MRPRFTFCAVATAAVAVLASSRAQAYDVLAVPCDSAPLTCGVGGIKFDKTDALPIQWSFDTGWVPQGSPLQVHLWADIWANTHVSLAGELQTSWPTAMTLEAPGNKEGGDFSYHYGADFGAQGMVSISVLGKSFSWQGDIPYVPQFDLEIQKDQVFDAWGYAPGITISGVSMPQQLADVSISDIIGSSIPGIDGGFELAVALELDATYVTTQLVVSTVDGEVVAGGPFTANDGESSTPYTNGPNIELDVHPEGTVNYTGVVHMIPAFYVSLLGNNWSIPVADIPISFPITQSDWVFDNQRVHVPLPDLAISEKVIDFGELSVGEKKTLPYQLWNAGEAKVVAAMSTSDAMTFPLLTTAASLDPGLTTEPSVEFIPQKAGVFAGQIAVASNDPNSPIQIITLKGSAKAKAAPPPPDVEDPPEPAETGNCACNAVGQTDGLAGGRALGLGALAAAALLRRRRKARG